MVDAVSSAPSDAAPPVEPVCHCPEETAGATVVRIQCAEIVSYDLQAGHGCGLSLQNPVTLLVASGAAQTCRVELTLSNGTTHAVDATFYARWLPCGSDPQGCGLAVEASPPEINLVECDTGVGPTNYPDGDACVNVDLSRYDRSCKSNSDCMAVTSGTICRPGCEGACPNAAINVDDKARYFEALAPLQVYGPDPCECGFIPAPDAYCIQGLCIYCRSGCSDAGP
jgi:hypothetical protein